MIILEDLSIRLNLTILQAQLLAAEISMSESASSAVSAEFTEDMNRLKAEVEIKNKQMEEVRRRAEEIEINFREVSLDLVFLMIFIQVLRIFSRDGFERIITEQSELISQIAGNKRPQRAARQENVGAGAEE